MNAQKIVGKMITFLVKVVFVVSVLGAILSFSAAAFTESIPQIIEFFGLPETSFDYFTYIGYISGSAGVLSGIGLKVTGYITTVNKVNHNFITSQNRIQKEYFDGGIDTIQNQLSTQETEFKSRTSMYKDELSAKDDELSILREELALKNRITEELKTERLTKQQTELDQMKLEINNIKKDL